MIVLVPAYGLFGQDGQILNHYEKICWSNISCGLICKAMTEFFSLAFHCLFESRRYS